MPPGAPAHMRAAAGLRKYARAAARAQPVHIHGFSCTLPRLHRDDAESGSYDQRGLLLTWCACTHAVSCVFVLAAWRHAYMHKSRCVLGFLHARHAGGSHVPTTQPSRARTSPGARRRTRTQEPLRAASPPMRPSTARTSPGAHPVRTYASDCAPPLQHRMHARRSSRARLLLHDSAANMTRRPQDGQLRAARMVTCVHAQEQLCAASPPRRSRSGRPRFARRQVRIHTCERSRLCVVSTAPCPHPRGSHVLLLRPPADDVAPPGDVLAKPNWLINQSSSS